jgi:hypothetical protein
MSKSHTLVLLAVVGTMMVLITMLVSPAASPAAAIVMVVGSGLWVFPTISYWRSRALRAEKLANAASRAQNAVITAQKVIFTQGGGWTPKTTPDLQALAQLRAEIESY